MVPQEKLLLKVFRTEVKELNLYITDQNRGMEKDKSIDVNNGNAEFTLDSASFTTLINK